MRPELIALYEMLTGGRSHLTLPQWVGALESRLLISDLEIRGLAVRLTEPQATPTLTRTKT